MRTATKNFLKMIPHKIDSQDGWRREIEASRICNCRGDVAKRETSHPIVIVGFEYCRHQEVWSITFIFIHEMMRGLRFQNESGMAKVSGSSMGGFQDESEVSKLEWYGKGLNPNFFFSFFINFAKAPHLVAFYNRKFQWSSISLKDWGASRGPHFFHTYYHLCS